MAGPGACAYVTAVLGVLLALGVRFQMSSPISPLVIDLGPLPTTGEWAPESNLENMERVGVGCEGPEDIAFDKQGRLYAGCVDGWVKRLGEDGKFANFSYTGGRPLGIDIRGDPEVMYVADSMVGLFEVSLSDGVARLVGSKDDEGTIINFADGVAISSDGTVLFTDASSKFKFEVHGLDILEARPNGRLLKYDPATKTLSVIKRRLWFPNGVALSGDEEFAIVAETTRARLMRLWLRGEKKGTWEVFLDGLPGFPDNVKYHDGRFYLGIVGKRTPLTDWLYKSSIGAQLRSIAAQIPGVDLGASSRAIARLLIVNEQGQLVKKYEDPTGKRIVFVTGGIRSGPYDYLTSLSTPYLGRVKAT